MPEKGIRNNEEEEEEEEEEEGRRTGATSWAVASMEILGEE
jgi:hypothetical protein